MKINVSGGGTKTGDNPVKSEKKNNDRFQAQQEIENEDKPNPSIGLQNSRLLALRDTKLPKTQEKEIQMRLLPSADRLIANGGSDDEVYFCKINRGQQIKEISLSKSDLKII